jgi:phage FluMu gp28-like protein
MARTVEQVYRSFLRPYQRRFVEDTSRRIIVLKSRRIGMSAAAILKSLLICLATPYHDVYLCSTSFTNAKELLTRLRKWSDIFEKSGYKLPIAENKKTELVFKNGSRIIPMPALKVRSRGGTVILDEFAFYQWDREVWSAVSKAALTDASMQIIIISTPFGESGEFWRIWNDPDNEYGDWSRHQIDIFKAVEQGFSPVESPEEIKRQNPRDVWLQEFCCEFLSDDDQYFPFDLIRRSQYSPVDMPDDVGDLFAGIDWASERDASVLAPLSRHGDVRWVLPMRYLKEAGVSLGYTEQGDKAMDVLEDDSYWRVFTDGVGEGKGPSQRLRKKFGRAIHLVKSASEWGDIKALNSDMKVAMQDGKFRIPNDRRVRAAWSAIQKKVTTTRKPRFVAQRGKFGHADEHTAGLLAYAASRTPKTKPARAAGKMPTRQKQKGW